MGTLGITIGGTDYKAAVDRDTFRVQQRGGVAVAEFTLLDKARSITIADDAEVICTEDATRIFAGYCREINPVGDGRTRFWKITAQDYNVLLDEDVVPAPAFRTVTESDRARVMWLFSTNGTKGITANTYVQTVLASMPLGDDLSATQDFGAKTFREACEQIAKISGAAFHVDFNKELHWYPLAGESLTAPFALSTSPNFSTTFPPFELQGPRSVAEYRNAVFVRGTNIYGWRPNPPPSAATRRAGVLRNDQITAQAELDAAGDAYLAEHAVGDNASCMTLQPGLTCGMGIQVTSPLHNMSNKVFSVREIETTLVNRTKPQYRLTLGRDPISLGGIIGGIGDVAQGAVDSIVTSPAATGQPVADLTIGGANLVKNSSMENKAAPGWAIGANWVFGFAVSDALSGARVSRVIEAAYAGTDDQLVTPEVAVDITDDYWISGWVYIRSRTAGSLQVNIRCKTSGGTVLSTIAVGAAFSAATTGWQRVSLRMGPNTAYGRTQWPATTAKIDIYIDVTGTATLTADVDGLQVERSDILTAYAPAPYELMDNSIYGDHVAAGSIGSTQIADDSITTPKLSTGSVDATKIAANAIVAGKIAAGQITSAHIAATGIDADLIKAGTLRLGAMEGYPDQLIVYDVDGDEIGRWGSDGLLITDAGDPLAVVRLVNGRLEFSADGGLTFQTAITAEGITADAILLGTFPGGSNRVPNSGFELAQFQTPLTKVWTAAADWGTTIGTDVNVTKTGADLVIGTLTY